MSLFKNIAIVGGSGTLGQHFVKAIHGEGDRFSLTVITRKAGEHQFPAGIKVIEVGDYSEKNDLLREALVGQDVLIAAHNGEFAPAANAALLSHAVKAGVRRIVPCDYSADVTHPFIISLAEQGKPMSTRAANIKNIFDIASTGAITYTILVPAGWIDNGLDNGFLGFDIPARKARLVDQGVHKATGCTKYFIALALLDMLLRPPGESENKKIHIAEVEYSGAALLKELEEETGAKWDVTHVTSAELIEKAEQYRANGDLRMTAVSLIHLLNYGGSGAAYYPQALLAELVGPKYQRKTLTQIVKEAVRKADEV
ncbi:hypothetical protein V495_00437 [Pseudogymnoascus sp. VKM F-4514 (FW-929)]|nr:hypothetical protein V495_00437 [Pseudogymnoascus sp. VKM F-4514 (FW-929)]KFY62902.1 hypothetical protein V497_02160 [Pseudogymnoascus sp. VKM F-4516 (FW-969)]